jgi:hypothetical protein
MARATLAIDMVKCVDEMGGSFREKFGNDEIYLAAIGVGSDGTPIKVPFFQVGGNFDDGEVRRYSPAKNLVTLVANGNCSAVLLLAERQHGGMNDALDAAFAKAHETLAAAKAKGDLPGGATGTGAQDEGQWIRVLAELAKVLLPILIEESKDKVFPPQVIGSAPASAQVEFRGHDGVYRVGYHWDVAA